MMLKYCTCCHLTSEMIDSAIMIVSKTLKKSSIEQLSLINHPFQCLQCHTIGHLYDEKFRHHFSTTHCLCVRICSPYEIYCFLCQSFQFTSDFDSFVGKKRPRLIFYNIHEYDNYQKLLYKLSYQRQEAIAGLSTASSTSSSMGIIKKKIQIPSVHHVKGICNMGNTCFMSSVLQVLLHNPIIMNQQFHKKFFQQCKECNNNDNGTITTIGKIDIDLPVGCIYCHFKQLKNKITRSSRNSNGEVVTPSDLLYTMWTSVGYMAGYRQQDAHEFLIAFLDALDDHSRKNHTDGLPRITSPRISPRLRSPEDATLNRFDSSSIIDGTESVAPSKSLNVSHDGVNNIEYSSSSIVSPPGRNDITVIQDPYGNYSVDRDARRNSSKSNAYRYGLDSSGSSSRRNSVDSLLLADRPLMKVPTSVSAKLHERTMSDKVLVAENKSSIPSSPFVRNNIQPLSLEPPETGGAVNTFQSSSSSSRHFNAPSSSGLSRENSSEINVAVPHRVADGNRGIIDLFTGWVESKLTCKSCRCMRRKREMFVDINLSVSNSALKKFCNSTKGTSSARTNVEKKEPCNEHTIETIVDSNFCNSTTLSTAMTSDEDFSQDNSPHPDNYIRGSSTSSIGDHTTNSFSNKNVNDSEKEEDLAEVSLEDCLRFYSTAENLTEKLRCEGCGRDELMEKQMSIVNLPDILILHLKRFDFMQNRKIRTHVRFPLRNWDISEFTSANRDNNGKQRSSRPVFYDLQGIVCHSGSLNQGHYLAYIADYIQTPFGQLNYQWLKCDDEHVTVVSDEEIQSVESYILFYVNQRLVSEIDQ